jgi:hypothetical protein
MYPSIPESGARPARTWPGRLAHNFSAQARSLAHVRTRWAVIALLIFLGALLTTYLVQAADAPAVITVDAGQKYQTITAWEATAQIGSSYYQDQYQQWASEVLQRAADLGINRLRVELKSGAENPVDYFSRYLSGGLNYAGWKERYFDIVNDNADPNRMDPKGFQFSELDHTIETVVLPYKRILEQRGEKLVININYVDFGDSAFEHKKNPAEYGELVLAVYQHMQQKYKFVPDFWEPILEPDTSARWSGEQIGQAVVAAGDRLKAAGFTPRFIVPSTTRMDSAPRYFDQIIAVPGALPYVAELSYHRYNGVSEAALKEIAARGKQYKIPTSMLEHIGSSFPELHQDLELGMNSAWQQFTLAWPTEDNGAQYFWIDPSNPAKAVVKDGRRTNYLRQYMKYIRPGAVRIGASTSNPRFAPLAFINRPPAAGAYVVVINADQTGAFSVRGLPPGVYGISYTTKRESGVELPDVNLKAGEALTASIPTNGILTIYARQPVKAAAPTPAGTPTPAPSILPSSTPPALQPSKTSPCRYIP